MEFRKLQYKDWYYVAPNEAKIKFGEVNAIFNPFKLSEKCFLFSFQQARDQNQWLSRPGGKKKRTPKEMFVNTLQGKMGEETVFQYYSFLNMSCSSVDYSRTALGEEDAGDLKIGSFAVQIKSISRYSQLLMLEKPSIDKTIDKYDRFLLTRIAPITHDGLNSVMDVINANNITDADFKDNNTQKIHDIIYSYQWATEIVGGVKKEHVNKIVKLNHILNQGEFLGKTTEMDAPNYYIIAGDLLKIKTKRRIK